MDGIRTATQTVTETLTDGTESQKQTITKTYTAIIDGALRTVKEVKTIAADGTEQVAKTLEEASSKNFSGLVQGWKKEADKGVLGTFNMLISAVKARTGSPSASGCCPHCTTALHRKARSSLMTSGRTSSSS